MEDICGTVITEDDSVKIAELILNKLSYVCPPMSEYFDDEIKEYIARIIYSETDDWFSVENLPDEDSFYRVARLQPNNITKIVDAYYSTQDKEWYIKKPLTIKQRTLTTKDGHSYLLPNHEKVYNVTHWHYMEKLPKD
jgi:hypothetical protein